MHNTQSQWITALLMALLVLPLTAIIHAQGQGPAPNLDNDRDGIPDRLETQLLARFTPYFRFSLDGGEEQYRPMDALNYVRWSELQNVGDEGKGVLIANSALSQNPNMLLSQGSSLLCDSHTDTKTCSASMQFRKDRFLNPLADVPRQGGNWARHGWAWADVLARRNVGLYGHVVHFRATPPQTDFLQCSRSKTASDTDRDWVLCDIDLDPRNPRSYYKVEYWQFFGYNGVG